MVVPFSEMPSTREDEFASGSAKSSSVRLLRLRGRLYHWIYKTGIEGRGWD